MKEKIRQWLIRKWNLYPEERKPPVVYHCSAPIHVVTLAAILPYGLNHQEEQDYISVKKNDLTNEIAHTLVEQNMVKFIINKDNYGTVITARLAVVDKEYK